MATQHLNRSQAITHFAPGALQFDVKSPNILLAREYTGKIADVGLAKFLPKEHLTQVASLQAGTPSWAAPELIR